MSRKQSTVEKVEIKSTEIKLKRSFAIKCLVSMTMGES